MLNVHTIATRASAGDGVLELGTENWSAVLQCPASLRPVLIGMDHRKARSRIARKPNCMLEGALRPVTEIRANDDPSHLLHAL
jgi:hypothetical protein